MTISDLMKMAKNSLKGVKTLGEAEITRHEQFLLLPVFSKDVYYRHVKTRTCLGKG